MPLEIHSSARKHYKPHKLNDELVLYAADHVLQSRPLDDEENPQRWLMIGVDPGGRLIELVLLQFDDGREIIIHAMKARRKYTDELYF
ncbi:toxin [Corynebacterium urinipleomorphum]|uniref:toxin n=1 Tax=Corynebacterium urinipleomorphum TaxID=1852380 RepID=UPI000B35EECD|nr:toxin [Corynebacterium urinipleomorphum]